MTTDRQAPGQERASWPASMMERVVGLISADYQRPVGPVVIALVLATGAVLESGRSDGPFAANLALALGLLGTAPIAVIRRFPAAAIGTVLAANATFVLFGRLSWSVAAVIGWLSALFAGPILLPRRWAARAVALTEVAVLLGVAGLNGNATPWDATAAEALAVLAAWGAGEMVRARRQAAADWAAAAEQVRLLSERELVAKERASIARELHDVVAHHVSMIAVRAATAPYSVPDLPEPGRAALAEIAEEARTALTELRVVLGVLRSPDGVMEATPQPRIADLECLVRRMVGAGMDAAMTVVGQERQLPGSIELCCYRVVQEALTNAGRHAHGSKVHVELGYTAKAVTVVVTNSAGDRAPGQSGRGAAWTDEGGSAATERGGKAAPQGAPTPGGSGGSSPRVSTSGRGAAWTDEGGSVATERGGKAAPMAPRQAGGPGGCPPGLAGRGAAWTDEGGSAATERGGKAAPIAPRHRGESGGRPPGQNNFGLTGLRERVAMLRGELAAGPDDCGGFIVRAVLPVEGES